MVEFILRSGDLGGGEGFSGTNRALEGTRGHQRLQKKRPPGYEAEIPVKWRVEEETFSFELKGRIDGVLVQNGALELEEIKTVTRPWNGPADSLHFGQAKIYGFLYAREHGFSTCEIRLTYLDLESDETVEFRERFSIEALEHFFDQVMGEYLDWIRAHLKWCSVRDQSIARLPFPFPIYRPGQRTLAVAVYRTVKNRGRLFAEAATGIGKTVSVLFPAIKAMGEGRAEKIFYLTAKTSGRAVAAQTIEQLATKGMRLRSITLTAKEKLCFNNGQPCDMQTCPYAIGYFDRIKTALREALEEECFDRARIEAIARCHQVCPFELSLDLSVWVDLIICDYNYAFDPSASLKRYFDGEKHEYAILVDEAHNLVDRAREMFSADLTRDELLTTRDELEEALPACGKALGKLATVIAGLQKEEAFVDRGGTFVSRSVPEKLAKALKRGLEEMESWLAQNEKREFRPALLETYFRALAFQRVVEMFDERFALLHRREAGRVRLFCLDPALLLRDVIERAGSAVFFSATLTPLEYFRESLGGDQSDPIVALSSPFPQENLRVLIQDRIATNFKSRASSYGTVAAAIEEVVGARSGNYLVFFPSYEYLRQVVECCRQMNPRYVIQAQTSGMTDQDRDGFLRSFSAETGETLVGFAVLGGVFGEGIDLVGDRLIGVVVVGIGLPQLCLERDLIREQCDRQQRAGFDHAYTFPGMNRVLQAAGRVIRSESDRGVVVLIDQRFNTARQRALFRSWWQPQVVRSNFEIRATLAEFWSSQDEPGLPRRENFVQAATSNHRDYATVV